jgi:hypothetical protein
MLIFLLLLCIAAGAGFPFLQNYLVQRRALVNDISPSDTTEIAIPWSRASRPREELCPHCSRLNPPSQDHCVDCGGLMPVASFGGIWAGDNRDDLIREGVQAGSLLAAMLILMALANFLPTVGKVAVLLLTVAALGYRFFRVLVN